MAIVRLEEVLHGVSEGVGVLELCVVVSFPKMDCPISFPFNISLSTSDGSAGKTSCWV